MLLESRLYSFIDQNEGFTLHFLEGQNLVQDIALTHKLTGEGFHFFRDILLSTQMLLSYLKPGEGLGVYLDSEIPYLKFKIEMSDSGQMRALLLPEEIKEFPKAITGKCRLAKTNPRDMTPYISIVDLNQTALPEVINKILKDSYQLKSQIFLSNESDQAIMIAKLPNIEINRIQTSYTLSVEEYWFKHQKNILEFFSKFSSDHAEIQLFFESLGLLYLSSREVKFKCTCSRDRMAHGLSSLIKSAGIDHVFMPGETEIQTKCDYCNHNYIFKKSEFFS